MAAHEEIEIRGLKEVQRDLRKLDPELKKALNAKLKELTGTIATRAKGRVPQGPAAGGHLGSSARPYVKQGAFGIRMGNNTKLRYGPWLEYGGKRPGDRHARPFIKTGRYLIKSYEDVRPTIIPLMVEAIEDAKRSAGLD